jgi:hypothetical protein
MKVYDYETIKSVFIAVFIDVKDPSTLHKFEISKYQNDINSFISYLKKLIKTQEIIVSFNGLRFDYQVSQFILDNQNLLPKNSGEYIANQIHSFVQRLFAYINDNKYPIYSIKENPFREIDLAAINNYNNKQKFASLKWLQYNMDWPNIMDMDCAHDDELNQKQIMELTRYCINDCLSTKALLSKNKEEIKIRETLTEQFKTPLQNLSEPKLVKAILLKSLSDDLDVDEYTLKKKQTYRKIIHLNEAILPYIQFKTPNLQKTLNLFKSLKLDGENLKGSFKHNTTYRGLDISFALGGIHAAKKGIYSSDKTMIIKSFDVKSYYPNLMIRNNWSPAHINSTIFCKRYEWFYNERLKYDKKNPLNYLYKIVLNSGFGLSNDNNSFIKDTFLTMQITCNGQLLLVQLMEDLCESIPGVRPLMLNTDGGEILMPKEYEHLYDELCAKWEKQTQLVLEHEEYQKLLIWDVNNYIGIFKPVEISKEKALEEINKEIKPLIKAKNGKLYYFPTKLKGRFEIDKALHKNKSYRIKRIAIYNYFIHNIPIEKTIQSGKNIYDYCAGVRAKTPWKFYETCVIKGEITHRELQKTLRYFISKSGCKIIKRNVEDDREIKLEAFNQVYESVAVTINDALPINEYKLDYSFYNRITKAEIESIQPNESQTNLF